MGDWEPGFFEAKQINHLARLFYKMQGYEVGEEFDFSKSMHPAEKGLWEQAKVAYVVLVLFFVRYIIVDIFFLHLYLYLIVDIPFDIFFLPLYFYLIVHIFLSHLCLYLIVDIFLLPLCLYPIVHIL